MNKFETIGMIKRYSYWLKVRNIVFLIGELSLILWIIVAVVELIAWIVYALAGSPYPLFPMIRDHFMYVIKALLTLSLW